jgi:hypothetical protein
MDDSLASTNGASPPKTPGASPHDRLFWWNAGFFTSLFGVVSFLTSLIQGRPTADSLLIALVAALVSILPRFIYHGLSRRDDSIAVIAFGTGTQLGLIVGRTSLDVLCFMAASAIANTLMAFVSGGLIRIYRIRVRALQKKTTQAVSLTLWDAEVDGRT